MIHPGTRGSLPGGKAFQPVSFSSVPFPSPHSSLGTLGSVPLPWASARHECHRHKLPSSKGDCSYSPNIFSRSLFLWKWDTHTGSWCSGVGWSPGPLDLVQDPTLLPFLHPSLPPPSLPSPRFPECLPCAWNGMTEVTRTDQPLPLEHVQPTGWGAETITRVS